MSLSPWDLSGNISFDFSTYRPRRPSYVFATQQARRRNESYRHATKSDHGQEEPCVEDFIEGIVKEKKYRVNHRNDIQQDDVELRIVGNHFHAPHIGDYEHNYESETEHSPVLVTPNISINNTPVHSPYKFNDRHNHTQNFDLLPSQTILPISRPGSRFGSISQSNSGAVSRKTSRDSTLTIDTTKSKCKYRKNLIVLSVSFILVFSAFRSIQNLQSSLNKGDRLGVITMSCVHGAMFLSCLFTPVLINKLTSKWTIVLGLLFYLFWIVANFYPHFYTLIPTSIGVGFGQSLAWGAQVTYLQKLALDYAHVSKELTSQELAKFNGIFLACFQTSHIWGNVISSVMLIKFEKNDSEFGFDIPDVSSLENYNDDLNFTLIDQGMEQSDMDYPDIIALCGVYDLCNEEQIATDEIIINNSTGICMK